MTQGNTGSRARRTNRPLKPADLPLRVPLLHGETTLSFLTRTATANGQPLPRVLAALHRGRLRLPEGELAPSQYEARLNAAAAARLAALTDRAADQLQRALPGLCTGQLPETAAVVQLVRWPDSLGALPLKACPLCMEDGAWLAAEGHRWRPCPCGRRWMGGDDGGYLLDTGPVPDLGRALQQHRALDHRLGAAGDALVADAHQIALWWWTSRQVGHELWRQREDAVGFARHRRRAAPAVVYPETMILANAMDRWERCRRNGRAEPGPWLEDLAGRLGAPGIVDGREHQPLAFWLELHPADPNSITGGRTTAGRRWAQLPPLHHRPTGRGPFRTGSCLRWTFGQPLTSTLEICPYCQGRSPSCYWAPAADCPERPCPT